MGATTNDASNLIHNLHSAATSDMIFAMIGGAIFNLANLLLVAAIDMAGLAIAFPVAIGIALVVGVITSYAQHPQGDALLLGLGVLCAVVAVVLDGKAYGSLASAGRAVSRKSIVVCIVSGVLMGLWAPFMTRTMPHEVDGQTIGTLGPYAAAIFLTFGALLSCFVWNIYFMKHPLVGEPVSFAGFFRAPASAHALGCSADSSGHGDGVQFGGRPLYRSRHLLRHRPVRPHGRRALGSLCLEGICGRARRPKYILALMFVFYCLGIVLVAKANG